MKNLANDEILRLDPTVDCTRTIDNEEDRDRIEDCTENHEDCMKHSSLEEEMIDTDRYERRRINRL